MLGVSKGGSSRAVYSVSKACVQWDFLGRGLVLFPTSDVEGFLPCSGHI